MGLSIDLSECPNKLSNYVSLVIISYKMTINSEKINYLKCSNKKKFIKLSSEDSREQNRPLPADHHLT